ncbi:glycosyltransferase [Paenibacillus sp. FSL E2-0178]|uniref:glycosyltransferase n=1 Tax=Paenibacillus sp. FSL E2-0178 TaxID=2921361 RepID=UPI003158B704
MGKTIVIEINFNNYGMNPNRLTREWISERIRVFRRFTLKSLEAQTNQQFLAVVKLAGGCSGIVEEELAQYPPLPGNIRFGTTAESNLHIASWVQEVRKAQELHPVRHYRDLFIARLDSDDLYHRTFVQQLHDYTPLPGTDALVNQRGYLWDAVQGQMAPVFYSSPQFYVFLYSADAYLAGERIAIPGKGHHNVALLPHEVFKARNFVNVVHSSNVSVKKVPSENRLSREEMKHVLAEFMSEVEYN